MWKIVYLPTGEYVMYGHDGSGYFRKGSYKTKNNAEYDFRIREPYIHVESQTVFFPTNRQRNSWYQRIEKVPRHLLEIIEVKHVRVPTNPGV